MLIGGEGRRNSLKRGFTQLRQIVSDSSSAAFGLHFQRRTGGCHHLQPERPWATFVFLADRAPLQQSFPSESQILCFLSSECPRARILPALAMALKPNAHGESSFLHFPFYFLSSSHTGLLFLPVTQQILMFPAQGL